MPDPAVRAYVSLGSNMEPEKHLRLACRELDAAVGPLQLSVVYRSRPVGFRGDDFLNMVVGFDTTLSPETLLALFETIHAKANRVRLPDPYSPRTLDIDLLLYGDAVHEALKIPHHDIDKYPFVLGPLAELAPDLVHPLSGKTLAGLWREFDRSTCPMVAVEFDPGL